jgi:hypothetical protein
MFLQPATNYKFKVRAKNIYGWGNWSPEATLFTSDVPLGTLSITMTVVNMNIKISWAKPFENYNALDKYRLYVRDTTGNKWNLEEENCDASQP